MLVDLTRRQALFKEVLEKISVQLTTVFEESSADGLADVPEARHSFSSAAAASAMAELQLHCAKRAVEDAAMKCIPLLKAAAATLAKPPSSRPRSDEQQAGGTAAADTAIFAAAVCVGRWGELLTVREEAEEAAHAVNAALKAARGLAARAAAIVDAMVKEMTPRRRGA
jgi:hypothetical protein